MLNIPISEKLFEERLYFYPFELAWKIKFFLEFGFEGQCTKSKF